MAALAKDVTAETFLLDAAVFAETERRLNEWGAACRRESHVHQRAFTTLADSAEHVRELERKRRGVRKKALRAKRTAAKNGKGPALDAKEAAEVQGFVERGVTARGKGTYALHEPKIVFEASVLQVDEIVRGMPGWMQKPIHRTYRYTPQQPFRIAARELRMDEDHYRSQWKAAVKYVAAKLMDRSAGQVRR